MGIKNYERELEAEILRKLADDNEVKRKTKEFAEEVRDTARMIAFDDMDKGYVTGEFAESIQVARRKNRRGQFSKGPAWMVVSRDDKANLLEYGTGEDAEGTHSPWGRFTYTPTYATFAKTALRYRGTSDGELGGSSGGDPLDIPLDTKNWIHGADSRGMSSIVFRHGDRAAAAARPIRQYDSNYEPFKDNRRRAKRLQRQYLRFLQGPETGRLRKFNREHEERRGRRD